MPTQCLRFSRQPSPASVERLVYAVEKTASAPSEGSALPGNMRSSGPSVACNAGPMHLMPQIHHLSRANARGPHQGDVPGMLRRVAESIEALGNVTVQDITFENEVTDEGLWPSMTVYFHYGALDEECQCGHCRGGMPSTD